jgi:WD40 repeat protein
MKSTHCPLVVAVLCLTGFWSGESCLAQPAAPRISLVGDLKVHEHSMAAAAFSINGDLIATTSIDRTVRVTDWRTGKTLVTLEGFSPGEEGTWDRTVLFLKDGERLLTANSAASFELWEWRTKKRLWKQEVGARSLALSPDETVLITADWEDPAVPSSRSRRSRSSHEGMNPSLAVARTSRLRRASASVLRHGSVAHGFGDGAHGKLADRLEQCDRVVAVGCADAEGRKAVDRTIRTGVS